MGGGVDVGRRWAEKALVLSIHGRWRMELRRRQSACVMPPKLTAGKADGRAYYYDPPSTSHHGCIHSPIGVIHGNSRLDT